jgi:quinone-modifying oxidoreductase subunit QmoC
MDGAVLIQPDTNFIRDVMRTGGGDLKKCYQCGTCSVTCELSPEAAPFPRRQMIRTQWGLSGTLATDPAIWLCHNCGKCSTRCPRGARPGDVLGALRGQAIRRLAFPGFMGNVVADPKATVLLFLLPALILLAIAAQSPPLPAQGPHEFAQMFPISTLEILFFAVSGLAVLAFAVSLTRFVRALHEAGAGGGVGHGLLPALGEIATHERFAKCDDAIFRIGHLLTMWGFIGLAVVGTVTGIGTMAGVLRTPLALDSPLKVFANAAAIAAAAGVVTVLARRIVDPSKRRNSVYFDWYFVATLAGVVITGLVAELLRLAQTQAMYAVYYVHLVLVFALLLYAPYSKFAHLAYRTVAVASMQEVKRRR